MNKADAHGLSDDSCTNAGIGIVYGNNGILNFRMMLRYRNCPAAGFGWGCRMPSQTFFMPSSIDASCSS